jgi:predicted ATP-dependent serine protease
MALLRQLPDSVLREDAPTLCKKFKTVKKLLGSDLSLFAPLTYKDAKSVKLRVARTCAPFALTGLQVYRDFIQDASVVSTGVISIDRLLNGGLGSGQIVELFGRSGTGKSELCHRLSANAALTSKKAVLYLQTKGDFRPEKMQEILQQLNADVKGVCTQIANNFHDTNSVCAPQLLPTP